VCQWGSAYETPSGEKAGPKPATPRHGVRPDEKADRNDEEHDARTDAGDSDAERALTAQELMR
jgi:hypothetical protein